MTRHIALAAFIGASVACVALLIGRGNRAERPVGPRELSTESFLAGSQMAIRRNLVREDGTTDAQWHCLQVLGVGQRKPADHPPGLIWSMSLEDGSIVWLLETENSKQGRP